ncbi:hypothetical protein [Dyella sp. C11]|uniref:hypothetical protein n=1 Tax=Dyella sp. C11 TaxID=2126991 RepID=UPI000D642AFF|nr:hypothetical protein [Dyella sp. C11]
MNHLPRASSALIVAACLLTGCATEPQQKPSNPPKVAAATTAAPIAAPVNKPTPQGGPVVVDQRPQSDKVHEIHSLWITSCDYGVFTLAEKKDSKSHVEALHDDLASMPGDPWHGHTITVTHYAAYLNMKRKLKGGVNAMYGGLIPSVMSQMGESCAENQMHGGWYAGTDLKNTLSPIVIEITATVDGTPHSVRSVFSPQTAMNPKLKQPSDDAQLAEAISKADADFAASLKDDDATSTAAGASLDAMKTAQPKP